MPLDCVAIVASLWHGACTLCIFFVSCHRKLIASAFFPCHPVFDVFFFFLLLCCRYNSASPAITLESLKRGVPLEGAARPLGIITLEDIIEEIIQEVCLNTCIPAAVV